MRQSESRAEDQREHAETAGSISGSITIDTLRQLSPIESSADQRPESGDERPESLGPEGTKALGTLQRMLETVARSLDRSLLPQQLLETAGAALDISSGAILIFDEQSSDLQARAIYPSPGGGTALDSRECPRWSDLLVREVVRRGAALALRSDEDWLIPPVEAQSLEAIGSAIGVPLRSLGRIVGAVVLAWRTSHPISTPEVTIASALAGQIGAVVECASLRSTLQDRERRVRELLLATVEAQEAERERICLEIHDGVAQTLAVIGQYQQLVEKHTDLRDESMSALVHQTGFLVERAIREAREVIGSLPPAALEAEGLVSAMRNYLLDLQMQLGWQVHLDATPVHLARAVETTLYRIMQEAVSNCRKHSRATRLDVTLSYVDDRVVLDIRDYGVGFDSQNPPRASQGRGIGLTSMRRRAELLGGLCVVHSEPGMGTTVHAEVPALSDDRG